MLYLSAKVLAEAVGVSYQMMNRWIQSGWLKAVDREGEKGPAIRVSAKDVLVQFESHSPFVESRPGLCVNLEALRWPAAGIRGRSPVASGMPCCCLKWCRGP